MAQKNEDRTNTSMGDGELDGKERGGNGRENLAPTVISKSRRMSTAPPP